MKYLIKVSLLLTVVLLAEFGCQVSKIEAVPVTASFRIVDGTVVKWGEKPANDKKQKVQSSATRVLEGDMVYLLEK